MKRSFVLVSACLLVLFFIFPALAQRPITLTLEPAADGLLKIHATVAGHPGTFLFDSGSGFSISPAFAAAIGCHPWGQITGFRMTGERLDMQHCDRLAFEMGGRSFPAPTLGVFDLSKYLPREAGPIDEPLLSTCLPRKPSPSLMEGTSYGFSTRQPPRNNPPATTPCRCISCGTPKAWR